MSIRRLFYSICLLFVLFWLILYYSLTSSIVLSRNLDDKLPGVVSSRNGSGQLAETRYYVPVKLQGHSNQSQCSSAFGFNENVTTNLNMLNIYQVLKFDNPDGGAWKQGWNVQVNGSRFSSEKLRVYVVPHSHNDPGWIKTYEQYYRDSTKHILDLMLTNLSKDKTIKFIWAEISFFSMWWDELSEQNKINLKTLVSRGQLEFVTGGWVMPDESSSHYYSLLTQLIEGHQWLYHHLGYTPKNGWSIDPFGMSPTMSYFLKRTGLSNMVIQRIHYSVKKHLAELQDLEFKWRQSWDTTGSTDMLCHMMPFYSYDVPHTCGPDPKVCCQFDFKRMIGVSSQTCPWRVSPQPITSTNLKSRSNVLLDQYRKKAMLFKTNVLLVPLGDDFRWTDQPEWTAQISNYNKIFEYINSNTHLNTEVKFGTLDDYFQALTQELLKKRFSPSTLTGDFFTYADRDDHYWSGYFTSRPFHKAMDRTLISHLRSSQILFSWMCGEVSRKYPNALESPFIRSLLGNLIKSRRILSLFQHHDGIAGTSKDHVMRDYANKMEDGLRKCNFVLQQSLYVLSSIKHPLFNFTNMETKSQFYHVIPENAFHEITAQNPLVLDRSSPERFVTVFNPTTQNRIELLDVYVSSMNLTVVDLSDSKLDFEIFPVFTGQTTICENVFHLKVLVEMSPLSIKHLKLVFEETVMVGTSLPQIFVKNAANLTISSAKFSIQPIEADTPLNISNGYLTVFFDNNGFASFVKVNGTTHAFNITMLHDGFILNNIPWRYGVAPRHETSGLYLFLPDGEAKPLYIERPFIRILRGKLMSFVEVWLKQVQHRITLYRHSGFNKFSVHVTNTVDIRSERNFELTMRFQTSIKSGNLSYTDLNGFQMIRRKRFSKLPIQAQYYPLPAATFIEDVKVRMTVLSMQPLGTASLSSGQLEIMLDRRLNQDDNLGAGQGCLDNVETQSNFKIIFETPTCVDPDFESKQPMLTMASQVALHSFLNPIRATLSEVSSSVISNYAMTKYPAVVPCDVQLIDMIMLPEYRNSLDDTSYRLTNSVSLLFHRTGFDERFLDSIPISVCSCEKRHMGKLEIRNITGEIFQAQVQPMSLSFIKPERNYDNPMYLQPMEIYGFLLKIKTP